MATDSVLGLFGMQSPQQLQQDYLSGLMVSPAQMGQQGLLQQLISTGANAGAMMGYGGGRLLGGKVAGEVESAVVNDALQQINKMDIKDPAEKMVKLSELLGQNPATAKQAMIAQQEAVKLKKQGYEMGNLERTQEMQKAVAAVPVDATPDERAAGMKDAIRRFGSPEQQLALAKEDAALAKEQTATKNRATALVSTLGSAMNDETLLAIAGDKELYKEVMKDRLKIQEQKTKLVNTKRGVLLVKDPSGEEIKNFGLPASGVTVVNKQDSAEDLAFGNLLVKQFEDVSIAAKNASTTKAALETNLKILDKKDFNTGFGTEAKAAAASVLSALGVKEADQFAVNAQMFTAMASKLVLQAQLAQKGPQTEPDARRIENTSAKLGNTKEANKFILKVAIAQAKKDMEQRDFYAKWKKDKGSFYGAENAWYEDEGGKSLFERPELKEYAEGSKEATVDQIPGGGTQTAPMYAVNPQTNQRIVSTDGGKTWQETR